MKIRSFYQSNEIPELGKKKYGMGENKLEEEGRKEQQLTSFDTSNTPSWIFL